MDCQTISVSTRPLGEVQRLAFDFDKCISMCIIYDGQRRLQTSYPLNLSQSSRNQGLFQGTDFLGFGLQMCEKTETPAKT